MIWRIIYLVMTVREAATIATLNKNIFSRVMDRDTVNVLSVSPI